MKQEFREPANYNAVLQAIASGAVTLSEIKGFTKLENNLISKYLLTLQELKYIERIIPFGANPLKGKKSQYRIMENFIAFWYRYVFPVRAEIERGNGDIYFAHTLENLSEFIGPIFETITLQYLRRKNAANDLPFTAKSFGSWWGRDKEGAVQEVDIVVAAAQGKELLIGECKWKESMKAGKTIDTLLSRAALFDGYTTHPYLFSKKPVAVPTGEVTNLSTRDYFKE
jgi:AAA+ ATPase superfamily predicted ATPase